MLSSDVIAKTYLFQFIIKVKKIIVPVDPIANCKQDVLHNSRNIFLFFGIANEIVCLLF